MNEPEMREFEDYLRQFAFQGPALLPQSGGRRPIAGWGVAVAALVIAACALVFWPPVPPGELTRHTGGAEAVPAGRDDPPRAVSLGRFNALLNEDASRLETALTEASPFLLPSVQHQGGSLWALAQD